jgi:hypothetical protein
MTRRLPSLLGIAAFMLTSPAIFAQTTTTTTTPTLTQSLPPFGLGSTETARIDLTNLASATSSGTAASCTGNVSFISATGTTIGTATPYTVTGGQTSSVSLAFTSAGFSGSRGELRVVIAATRTAGVPCNLQLSLQTFDTSSGATHFYLTSSLGEISIQGPARGF